MSQNSIIQNIENSFLKSTLPAFRAGDSIRVHSKIREGDKERIQVFEGIVIGLKRGGIRGSFTVRKVSYGMGVERVFPTHSSRIEKIEVVSRGQVRRARLNFLRDLKGKAARIKSEVVGMNTN
jgi:large subunit ribosomal protein L19